MIKIPEWLAKLPKNSSLNVREFADALGISKNALMTRRSRGYLDFPDCDFTGNKRMCASTSISGLPKKPRPLWKAVTVRNYIRHLNRMELAKNERNKG